jgi:Protein of unknown function (DUF3105)
MCEARSAAKTGVDKNAGRRRRRAREVGAIACVLALAIAGGCRGTQTTSGPAKAPRQYVSTASPEPSLLPTGTLPGRAVPVMKSRRHISPGPTHEPYNTDPPTSGPHYPIAAKAGFYTAPLPDEQLVHNLEHGYVVIWYKTEGLSPYERARLASDINAVMLAAGNSPKTNTPKLIAVPRQTLKSRLALTTWGRMDELPSFSRQEILDFIHAFRDKAPEPTEP